MKCKLSPGGYTHDRPCGVVRDDPNRKSGAGRADVWSAHRALRVRAIGNNEIGLGLRHE